MVEGDREAVLVDGDAVVDVGECAHVFKASRHPVVPVREHG